MIDTLSSQLLRHSTTHQTHLGLCLRVGENDHTVLGAYVTLKRCPCVSQSSPSVGLLFSRAPKYVQSPWTLVKVSLPWTSPSCQSPSYLSTHDDTSMHRCQCGRLGHCARKKALESKHFHDCLPHYPVEICHTQTCYRDLTVYKSSRTRQAMLSRTPCLVPVTYAKFPHRLALYHGLCVLLLCQLRMILSDS